mmetsp:Transcript_136739/g.292114  ORF Transcript_136739/g.292114 Transcript_136739/m.292114 type:complete len:216 (-) Transcript_136739:177-824(-)
MPKSRRAKSCASSKWPSACEKWKRRDHLAGATPADACRRRETAQPLGTSSTETSSWVTPAHWIVMSRSLSPLASVSQMQKAKSGPNWLPKSSGCTTSHTSIRSCPCKLSTLASLTRNSAAALANSRRAACNSSRRVGLPPVLTFGMAQLGSVPKEGSLTEQERNTNTAVTTEAVKTHQEVVLLCAPCSASSSRAVASATRSCCCSWLRVTQRCFK